MVVHLRRRTDGADRIRDTHHDPIEHGMASTTSRPLAAILLLSVALIAGCSTGPSPETDVAGTTVTPTPTETEQATRSGAPATAAPSEPAEPPTMQPPDLSGNEIDCDAVDEPCDYGEDAQLDLMWDACADGDGTACDRLYYDSAFDTRYEQFGNTCGDRGMTTPCPERLEA